VRTTGEHAVVCELDFHLDFRAIVDESKALLLGLGRLDGETHRLISSPVATGPELAMRRRRNHGSWNLTIDEFTGYVTSEGAGGSVQRVC
jgi:hypothetical protein